MLTIAALAKQSLAAKGRSQASGNDRAGFYAFKSLQAMQNGPYNSDQ